MTRMTTIYNSLRAYLKEQYDKYRHKEWEYRDAPARGEKFREKADYYEACLSMLSEYERMKATIRDIEDLNRKCREKYGKNIADYLRIGE